MPVIGDRAEALWKFYVSAPTPMARFDAENLVQSFSLTKLGSQIRAKTILLPVNLQGVPGGEIHLGSALYGEKQVGEVRVSPDELMRHVGLFATTGSGKTNLCYYLLIQLVRLKIPFLVVDWKRSYRVLRSLPEARGIKVFTVGRDVRPIFWNPLRPPPRISVHTWITILSEVLEKSHVSGQGVADILMEHISRAFEVRERESDYPNFHDVRESVGRVTYKGRRQLWQDSCLRILRSLTFGPATAALNHREPAHLENLLNEQVIFELDQELPKNLRVFLVEVLFRWIHLFRLGQGETGKLRHVLVLEEVHNLFPRSSFEFQSASGLENVFRELRSFGQGLVSVTQHPSVLPIYILGNTNTLIFMGLTHESDIFAARQALFLQREEGAYLDQLKVGEGIVKIKGRVPACHVRFPLVPLKLGSVSDARLRADAD